VADAIRDVKAAAVVRREADDLAELVRSRLFKPPPRILE
jgi:hypothetical protein